MHSVIHFFDSTFFLALVTLGVGGVALYIYRKQHRDERKEAAQAIINEIISAENKLQGIRQRFFASQAPFLENSFVMQDGNWATYRHLFVEPLTRSEWDLVDNFYSNCIAYDSAVRTNSSYTETQIAQNYSALYKYYYRVVIAYHASQPNKKKFGKKERDDIKGFTDAFLENIVNQNFGYIPVKPTSDARVALVALDTNVSTSTAGQKLKDLSGLKFDA